MQGKSPKPCWRKVRRLDEAVGVSRSFSLKWVFRGSLNEYQSFLYDTEGLRPKYDKVKDWTK